MILTVFLLRKTKLRWLKVEQRMVDLDIKVKTSLHMERPVVMPTCGDLLCPLSTFRSDLLRPILEVDLEDVCNHDNLRPPVSN